MSILVDNDVFFAAIYAGHAHHALARKWLDRQKRKGWAIATETWLAAMRLLMNPSILGSGHLNGDDAWRVVEAECGGKYPARVVFTKKTPDKKLFSKATSHRQVMDFWLVQLAKQEAMKVATFDRALHSSWPEHVLLVPGKPPTR